jgi:hypothetical protein
VATNEDIGCSLFEYFFNAWIEVGRSTANVRHPNGKSFAGPPDVFRVSGAQFAVIDVAVHSPYWSYRFQGSHYCAIANVTGMPDFIARQCQPGYLRVQEGVGIGE